MNHHDPLTCPRCSPEPKAQAQLRVGRHVRRFTGVAALLLIVGPIAVPVFALGFLVGLIVGAMK